jgi:outer membrane protein assembly factor BamE
MKRLALPTILLAAGALFSSGCVYKMNIQQGNYLVAESVSQLKEGMTRSQVRFLLGTPMVPVAFDDSRWDYYYFFSSKHYKQPLKRRLTVYFADEKVQRFENQGVPTEADLVQLESDLRKAQAANKKKQPKQGMWGGIFQRDPPKTKTGEVASDSAPAPAPSPEVKPETEKKPDPVPPAAPLPEPAGTPSGPP